MLMPAFLYIDPGTGGMLFTIIFAALGTVYYLVQALSVKLKFMISGGKAESISEEKIPIAIFSDHKRYFNIYEPICDELERRGQKASFLTASEDDPIFEKNYKNIDCVYLGEGNKAFSKLNLLNATMVLSTTPSLDVFQWKRSKDVNYYVHIPHAPDDITKYRMFGIDSYDALLLSGEYQIDQVRELEHLRGIPEKETALVGIPYMDEMKKRLEKEGAAAEHDRTVLLAPSWGESGILSKYGEKFIDALIATGYHVIVRPHPQSFASEKELMDKLMQKYNDPAKVEWNRDNDNFDVLHRSDILISDFSGVLFDYSLVFDKPVIYTGAAMDKSPYDCAWSEKELWSFEILPKLGMELKEDKIDHIKEVIDECIESPAFKEGRDIARRETWVNIDEGANKTVDYLINKYKELTAETVTPEEGVAVA